MCFFLLAPYTYTLYTQSYIPFLCGRTFIMSPFFCSYNILSSTVRELQGLFEKELTTKLTALKKQLERSIVFTTSKFELPMFDCIQGRIQDFKLGGGALEKIALSGGRCEFFWGISCEKSRFYAKKSYFFQFQGVTCRMRPPPLNLPLQVEQPVYLWTVVSVSLQLIQY